MTDRDLEVWAAPRRGGPDPRRTVTLTELIRIPAYRWRLIAAAAGAGLIGAVGYLLLVPPTVSAAAVVAVRPVVTDAFTYPGAADRSVNMNVESGIATSTEVVRKLAEANGDDPVRVREALTVEVPTGGQILRFIYRARTAEETVATVNLAARTYLEVRQARYEEQRSAMLKSYDDSIAKVTARQAAVQRRARSTDGGANAALAELTAINGQLVELNSARTEIAAIDVTPGWVTQTAEPALADADASPLLHLLAATLGGVLLGLVLTYLAESVDRRVRSAADAQEATLLPLLGTVRRRGLRVGAHAVDADVRYVAMAIAERFRAMVQVPNPVVVISAREQEDTTQMTASLAVALAADGRSVYVGDDSGRLDALSAVLTADRRRMPSRPVLPEPAAVAARSQGALTGPGHGFSAGSGHGVPADSGHAVPAGSSPGAIAGRRPSPRPIPPPRSAPAVDQDPYGLPPSRFPAEEPASAFTAEALPVGPGPGIVRTGSYHRAPAADILLFNAPPAESDERGVREARNGAAIVLVERDRTRVDDLRRLVDRLRAAGAEPLGFVLTRSGRG